ncbi:MAG: hypothetical protein JW940_31435 [Polyangiaceae bacterium]|nr:hypothetical protein [Polyangiaceae bacterium]
MTSPTSFVINTGNPQNDQQEVARYQQHYQAQGLMVQAQPQPQGGYLVTVYSPGQGPGSAPQQYAPPAQAGQGAAPQQQYAPPAQPGAPQWSPPAQPGAAPQQWAPPAQPGAAPQQWAPPAQSGGYGAPQQYPPAGQAPAPGTPPAQPYAPPGGYGAQPGGYGAPQPGFGAGPGIPGMGTAPAKPAGAIAGFLGSITLGQKIKYGGTALVILGLVGWSFFLMRKAAANVVLFENSLDVPGELSLAGKSHGTIAPKKALRLELDKGSYALSFVGNGAKLDEGTLVVPGAKDGLGYHAVYNLGGKKGIAVVTKYYGGTFKDQVAPVAEGTHLVEVAPTAKLERIDDTFPDSITVPKHATFGSVILVCHVDEEKQTVGCPGW